SWWSFYSTKAPNKMRERFRAGRAAGCFAGTRKDVHPCTGSFRAFLALYGPGKTPGSAPSWFGASAWTYKEPLANCSALCTGRNRPTVKAKLGIRRLDQLLFQFEKKLHAHLDRLLRIAPRQLQIMLEMPRFRAQQAGIKAL